MTSDLLNTHHYDGKLKHYKQQIPADLKNCEWLQSNILPFEKAIEEAQGVSENKVALATLKLFLEDKQQNYDPTSDLSVEEVFPIVWASIRSLETRMEKEDAKRTRDGFFEQLADVQGGQCAQGRVSRLLNYYAIVSE